MIEGKELPSEYVSIRTIWLRGIEECRKAISQKVMVESSEMNFDRDAGDRTVVHTVNALYLSLVDYGEATIRTDVDEWYNTFYKSENKKIWEKVDDDYSSVGDRTDYIHNSWIKTATLSEKFYDFIIKTLNKYGMLFPEQPQGYSNVEMKSV